MRSVQNLRERRSGTDGRKGKGWKGENKGIDGETEAEIK
jgi:hypothetical protein